MTNHTPTPRTAAEVEVVHQGGLIAPGDGFVHHTGECEMVSADFARTLERELAEANLRFAKGSTWIPVSERMPDRYEVVLVAYEGAIAPTTCRGLLAWDGDAWRVGFSDDRYPGTVTHWMPLPEAPK